MAHLRLLSDEQMISSIKGVTLTSLRIIYNFRVGFLTMLLTGRMHAVGTAPLQHVSAVEIVRRRYPSWLALAVLGALSGLSLYTSEDLDQTIPLIFLAAALVCLVIWLLVFRSTLVISVDGARFVIISANLSSAQMDTFMSQYTALKARELPDTRKIAGEM